MSIDTEKLTTSLKTIAGITYTYKPENPERLQEASDILADLAIDESSGLFTLFSSTQMMTKNYIDKMISGLQDDIEPVNDGIILLRAIVRSLVNDSTFVFEDKDIHAVIENLEAIKSESQEETPPEIDMDQLSSDIDSLYKLTLTLSPLNKQPLDKMNKLVNSMGLHETSQYFTMFSSVLEMASSYLNKIVDYSEEETEPLKDAILLLRAVARSEKNDSDFPFENKDILSVVENLGDTSTIPLNLIDSPAIDYDELLSSCDEITKMVSTIQPDDIPALGKVLNRLEIIEDSLYDDSAKELQDVCKAIQLYIEKLILGDKTETDVLIDCFHLMKSYIKALSKGEDFPFDFNEIMTRLHCAEADQETPDKEMSAIEALIPANVVSSPITDLDEEDMEVLEDFLIESRDNLDSIEINLIDLEQSPGDTEIINAIFRPFHTIKGVSGFLDLRKINALSHSTENLLDSAREGYFIIDNEITDLILKSVDVLKRLLGRVEKGLQNEKTADDDDISINELIDKIENTNRSGSAEINTEKPMGEILIEKGFIKKEDLSDALLTQAKNPDKKLGEILVENQVVETKEVISALRDQKRVRKQSTPQVKVDTGKLDNLVDLTGELVIAQSMLKQNSIDSGGAEQIISQNLNHLGQIVSNIQKIAMSMRMVPISATFQKMVRLVRDLSRSCDKDVHLEMIGEETEIDRNVVEALYEPMVHMIRNSIDHGLETKQGRTDAGKAAKGNITLHAYHKGGNIIIEISDDGRGLNRFNILDKALHSGIITGEEDLSDEQIYKLIMAPGFSTAAEVTDISGRGVGMDVVKKAIEDLNGRIDIQSDEGKGSTFTISLPLTLAIIEGMLVRIGDERFIIPTMTIIESFRPLKDDYYTVEGKSEMLMFRKSLVPLIRLNRICKVEMDNETVWESIVIVVENKNDQRGILIDELLGKEEFVIKSLGESLKGINGLAGGAILGNGRVGLIIDINGIFKVADTG